MRYQLIDAERGVFLLQLPVPDHEQRAVIGKTAAAMAVRHSRTRIVLLLGSPQPRLYMRNCQGPLIPCRKCEQWFPQRNQEELCPECHAAEPVPTAPRRKPRRRRPVHALQLPLFGPGEIPLCLPPELGRTES